MEKQNCEVEIFSRVTGFFRPVQAWNPGKKEEFMDRAHYDISGAEKSVNKQEEQHG